MSVDTLQNYELQGLLGEGGIGRVYAAQDKVLGRRVAIKALRPEISRDRSFVDRFYNEAKSLANLNHTNITTLYALHVEGSEAFMVMELVDGQTLEALLARVGRLTLRDSLAILAQAIPGIRYAHRRGIIHRDLKPANLMLTDDGIVKIMDFGIARVEGSEHLTRVGEFCGTFVYASPEQIRGEDVDERSDLYSMAIVLYRMLTGAPPFTSTNEYALMTAHLQTPPPPLTGQVPDLDAGTEVALMRALAKRPEDRFASVEEFGRAVGSLALRDESVEILQQVYARAFSTEDPETTRIVSSARPPIADPKTSSKPSQRSTAEWELPPNLLGSEPAIPQPESRPSGRRPVLADTQLHVLGRPERTRPRLSRRRAIAGTLIATMVLGGAYLGISHEVLPGLFPAQGSGSDAATGEPGRAALPAPVLPQLVKQQASGSIPPKQLVNNEPLPPKPTSTVAAPVEDLAVSPEPPPPLPVAPPAAPPFPTAETAKSEAPAAQVETVSSQTEPRPSPPQIAVDGLAAPILPPSPVEATKDQPAPPPAQVEAVSGQAEPRPSPQIMVDGLAAPILPPSPVESTKDQPAPPPAQVEAVSGQAEPRPSPPQVAVDGLATVQPILPHSPVELTKGQPVPPSSVVLKNEPKPPVPPATAPAKSNSDEPPSGISTNPASAASMGTQSAPLPPPATPMVVAKAEPAPSEPRAALGPQAAVDPLKPEGEPDLEGKVTGVKRLDEIEIAAKWIKIYGIVDRALGAQESQHVKVLVGYLKPSRNHLVCYRKAADTYRCYSDGKDIARLALQGGMVDLAPNAPAEYRSLLPARR